jgi:hypothetical protein
MKSSNYFVIQSPVEDKANSHLFKLTGLGVVYTAADRPLRHI